MWKIRRRSLSAWSIIPRDNDSIGLPIAPWQSQAILPILDVLLSSSSTFKMPFIFSKPRWMCFIRSLSTRQWRIRIASPPPTLCICMVSRSMSRCSKNSSMSLATCKGMSILITKEQAFFTASVRKQDIAVVFCRLAVCQRRESKVGAIVLARFNFPTLFVILYDNPSNNSCLFFSRGVSYYL
jgi:hypothetical protein